MAGTTKLATKNPFANALAGSASPETPKLSSSDSFANALARSNGGGENFGGLQPDALANIADQSNYPGQRGFDSPELRDQALADEKAAMEHKARLAAESNQKNVFDAEKEKSEAKIAEIRAYFLKITIPETRTQMKTAVADAQLIDNMPQSLDGAKGTLSYWQAMILKAGNLNRSIQSAHDAGSWNRSVKAKKAKMGPGAGIARAGRGHRETKAVQTEMNSLDRSSGE